tara:strand:+ start:1215 stop:1499 length:285 start_codon:yes stop_codon:yes gene_type:complete
MFKPLNRYILVNPVAKTPEKQKTAGILVPEEYVVKEHYKVYEVVDISPECERINQLHKGKNILVNNAMVEQFKVDDEELYVVAENHIYGIFLGG